MLHRTSIVVAFFLVGSSTMSSLRKIAYLIAAIAPLVSSPAFAFEPHIERLLGQYSAYEDICRGHSDESPVVEYACNSRDEVGMLLGREGLCYGKKDQAMYEMKWHVCTTDSNQS